MSPFWRYERSEWKYWPFPQDSLGKGGNFLVEKQQIHVQGTVCRTVGGGQCLSITGEMKGWAEIGHKDLKYESKSFMLGAAGNGKMVERSIKRINKS